MSDPLARFRRFLQELKRRKVYRVAAVYAGVAFLVVEAANLVFPALNIPSWAYSLVVVLALLGFPIAVVLAWAFEVTPEGVRRTPENVDEDGAGSVFPEQHQVQSRLAIKALVGLGLLGAAVAGGWYLMGGGGGPSAEAGTKRDTASTEPRAGDRSIAVLPFENMGGEESEQFTRGVHDDLLTRLAHVSGLKVISRTAVQPYGSTNLATQEIADSLGVRWVVEGAVQKMGDEIQVNAQLIDPRTETHAWADRYRRDLTAANLFDLQSEITKKIARSLEAELTPEETGQVERRPTEDLDAYKLYVQGRSRLDTRTEDGIQKAIDFFQRAIEQDSSYALAWSGLADAIDLYSLYSRDPVPSALPNHTEPARRALELDPDLAEAHASVGWVHIQPHASMGWVHYTRHNAPSALRGLQRAVELKPSYAQAHHWLGLLLFNIGRLEDGYEHLSLAVELNPRHAAARYNLVDALIARGDLEGAERHVQQVSLPGPRRTRKADILYHARRWDELEGLAREQLEEDRASTPLWRFHLARIAALRGDTAAAREQLAWFRENEEYFGEGLVHAALGETAEAFSGWANVENWAGAPSRILRYPFLFADILGPLRADSRYRKLIRKSNQQWGLNPDGSLPDSVDVSFDAPADE